MTAKQTWSTVGGAAAAALMLLVGLIALFVTVGSGAGEAAATVSAQYAAATPASAQSVGDTLKPGSVPAEDEQWIVAAAGACPGLPAPVLAAQLHQESGFDPKAVSAAGAQGIAQFMPGTWNTWKTDANGNGTASVWEAPDAITAQGHFMCKLLQQATDSGYDGQPIELALAGYNAGWGVVERFHGVPPVSFAGGQTAHYVTAIMAAAQNYAAPAATPGPYDLPATTPAAIRVAIAWGLKQVGGWYSLGGDCTDPLGTAPSTRCDCSSLIQQAYRAAGISLPRTTFAQVKVGTAVSPDSPLPGDLVFSPGTDGTASSPGHVGLYLGGGHLRPPTPACRSAWSPMRRGACPPRPSAASWPYGASCRAEPNGAQTPEAPICGLHGDAAALPSGPAGADSSESGTRNLSPARHKSGSPRTCSS